MPRQWMMQRLSQSRRLLPGTALALAVVLLFALACRTEPTVAPVPTPAPTAAPTATAEPTATPAPTPTPTAEPTAEPYDGATAFAEYWNPPTDYYGEPVYGGTLRIAYEDFLEHANVWGAFSGTTLRYRVPTGATLVMENPYDAGVPLLPDLARAWTLHDGQDGVTFDFREGANWHNGELFVCEDARFTFETMITGEGITHSRMKDDLTHVVLEEMTCLDDLTLEVKFSGPTAIPLHVFSHPWGLVFNKAWFLEGGEEAMFVDVNMGIGPFRWAEGQWVGGDSDGWNQGHSSGSEEQRFERNHDYFIPELPYVDELVIYGILDDSARKAAHLAHQTDWLWVRNVYGSDDWYQQYQDYVDHDQIVTVIGPTRGNLRLWINPRHRPFGNARIRQAIVMGIDGQAFIEDIAGGHGTVGGFGYALGSPWELPREQRCSVPGWCVSEDMEATRAEARAILEEEGFDFDKTYVVWVHQDSPHELARTIFLQKQLQLLGINTDAGLCNYFRCEYDPDFELIPRSSWADDPNAGVERLLACDSYGKERNPELCTPDIIALLDRAQVETDPAKRLALAHEIELAAMKQYSSFPIYWEQEAAAFWPEVRGYVHFPSPSGSFLKFMHMWIDSAHMNDTGYTGQTTGVPGGI